VDGTVVSRSVTKGQTVAASFQTPTLFLIATDLTKMEVDANVSESDIGGIKVGENATFTVDAFPKRTFKGTVSQVRQSPQTVQNVVTYDVVMSVDNQDLALKPGMTAATGSSAIAAPTYCACRTRHCVTFPAPPRGRGPRAFALT
jgi:HlyD family secretion protein